MKTKTVNYTSGLFLVWMLLASLVVFFLVASYKSGHVFEFLWALGWSSIVGVGLAVASILSLKRTIVNHTIILGAKWKYAAFFSLILVVIALTTLDDLYINNCMARQTITNVHDNLYARATCESILNGIVSGLFVVGLTVQVLWAVWYLLKYRQPLRMEL